MVEVGGADLDQFDEGRVRPSRAAASKPTRERKTFGADFAKSRRAGAVVVGFMMSLAFVVFAFVVFAFVAFMFVAFGVFGVFVFVAFGVFVFVVMTMNLRT